MFISHHAKNLHEDNKISNISGIEKQ